MEWIIVELSQKVHDVLVSSDWNSTREVDISEYVDFLNMNGYYVNPKAKEFLRSFGGVRIKPPNCTEKLSVRFHFNPLTSHNLSIDCVRSYERILNEKLTLVGFSPESIIAILISESGKFYGGTGEEDLLFFLGNDINEVMEELLNDGYGVQVDL